ncbi:MAG: hypothetical protein KME28_11985 [Pelatocladus maniniholoensis HA4357-MV3]|jgi:uncharacterized membrane protein (UPF0136 family)|uniref:Small integral membrane protein n=1 Tax=Pelatocladus maniniholoensis HA4357-MV3 TaxID=1117104 RepID=A0A9E3H7X9_9NOST|nr:hypothetical protein [Pelatocladus maniniholoensis HA4357-MV3]BAZ66824.1 hypothetical protein NIES4106_15770 [Fischerella sp. NIES-4106]
MNLGIVAALAYGILTVVGGIVGYITAGSNMSLFSGSISGLILIFSALIQIQGQNWGLTLAAIVTAILIVVFAFRLAKTRKFMPAGLMTILGMLTLALIVHQFQIMKLGRGG